jgi:hypothetical protein
MTPRPGPPRPAAQMFPRPADWLARRTAYTRSVAVCSVAGYVLGLGDRHGGNILLDQGSAECVHIDLGIAFEQGGRARPAALWLPACLPARLPLPRTHCPLQCGRRGAGAPGRGCHAAAAAAAAAAAGPGA